MTTRVLALAATVAATAQAAGTLISRPHATFTGSGADTTAELLFTLALILAAAAWTGTARSSQGRAATVGQALVVVGVAGLATGVIGTVIAGREVLSVLFVVGFGLLEVGLVVTATALRRAGARSWWAVALGVPAVVLSLAFYDTAGMVALALTSSLLAATATGGAAVRARFSQVAV